jgi:hypothetical protein
MTLQNRFAPAIYFTELLLLDENSLSGTIPRELGNLLHTGKLVYTTHKTQVVFRLSRHQVFSVILRLSLTTVNQYH